MIMNKILTMMVAVVLSSASLQAAGVVWSLQSGTVTVPAGETYVVTQADMASVNALDGIVVSGATDDLSAGVLEFRNCTTIPKSGLLKGEGVVKKTGAEVWTFDSVNADFTALNFVESHQKVYHCCFTGTGRTDYGNLLTGLGNC